MKTIKQVFLMTAMVIAFEGCKKDDPKPNASALIGSWEETSYVVTNCTDPLDNEALYECTTICEILEVSATTVTLDGDGPYDYTASGNTVTIDLGPDGTVVVTYSISGTTLTISIQDSLADGGCKTTITYTKV